MRYIVGLGIALACSIGAAQDLPVLGKPLPVDLNVTRVLWHPSGKSLLYTQKEGTEQAIGGYLVGKAKGQSLIKLGEQDRFQVDWFPGRQNAAVIVTRPFVEEGKPKVRMEANLVDMELGTNKTIFSRVFDQADKADINFDASPNLLHAIFRVRSKGVKTHFVLKTGTLEVSPSPDLDEAVRKGLTGPAWSIDGTAVYFPGGQAVDSQRQAIIAEVENLLKQRVEQRDMALIESRLASARSMLDASTLRIIPLPIPANGATVMELMPQNAMLRQVRFRGPWEVTKSTLLSLESDTAPAILTYGRAKGQANSIWLTLPGQKEQNGVLLAPNATMASVSPFNEAVAYINDGVLFVRTIAKKQG